MSKTPAIIPHLFPNLLWRGPAGNDGQRVYLTFDDGPVPDITPWVLELLKKYNARATFFCIGKNVKSNPEIYNKILKAGHAVGNHTFNHVSGYKSKVNSYVSEVKKASEWISSDLFRPPYGRIRWSQAKILSQSYSIVMWDVLSGDFDPGTSPEKCINNVMKNIADGSIVVFHDSIKAAANLKQSLPTIMDSLSSLGYKFDSLKSQTNL